MNSKEFKDKFSDQIECHMVVNNSVGRISLYQPVIPLYASALLSVVLLVLLVCSLKFAQTEFLGQITVVTMCMVLCFTCSAVARFSGEHWSYMHVPTCSMYYITWIVITAAVVAALVVIASSTMIMLSQEYKQSGSIDVFVTTVLQVVLLIKAKLTYNKAVETSGKLLRICHSLNASIPLSSCSWTRDNKFVDEMNRFIEVASIRDRQYVILFDQKARSFVPEIT